MTGEDLVSELSKHIAPVLAEDLVNEFVELRNDAKTGILGRTSAGKFVETVVQVLQFLESGKYDDKPKVDEYLRDIESRKVLHDDLRVCCSRVARSCYTLRNKRNIAHKGSVEPNIYDLRYTFASAQWIMSELVRHILSSNMTTAGKMIEFIQIPVSVLVEDLEHRKLVFGNFTVDEEIIVLLHSYYPEEVTRQTIRQSLDRRASSSISKSLNKLWKGKFLHKRNAGFKLTQQGFKEATRILQESQS